MNQTTETSREAGWLAVCRRDDLSETVPREFEVDGLRIVLVATSDLVYAVGADCPHQGAPLVEGEVVGTVLTCSWHGFTFDLESGACLNNRRTPPCVRFPVRVTDGVVEFHASPTPAQS